VGLIQHFISECSKIAIFEISEVTALCGSARQKPSVRNHIAKLEAVSANDKKSKPKLLLVVTSVKAVKNSGTDTRLDPSQKAKRS
jgi:hypothetical protein